MTKHMPMFKERFIAVIASLVPHRHMVFCIPKASHYGFLRNRKSRNVLSRLAFETMKDFTRLTLNRKEPPGAVQIIQAHGNMVNSNPHIHIIVSDDVFSVVWHVLSAAGNRPVW